MLKSLVIWGKYELDCVLLSKYNYFLPLFHFYHVFAQYLFKLSLFLIQFYDYYIFTKWEWMYFGSTQRKLKGYRFKTALTLH